MKTAFGVILVGVLLLLGGTPALACRYTPLEWQQPVEKHGNHAFEGQRKLTRWINDRDGDFIEHEIPQRFHSRERVNIIVDLNRCLPIAELQRTYSKFGRIAYAGRHLSYVVLMDVRVDALPKLAALPEVAMIEWQAPVVPMTDVSTRAVQARASLTYKPMPATTTAPAITTAEDLGFSGNGVTIAVVDTGVDDGHEVLAGKIVAGFDALRFEDTNDNGVDDSCEPAPLGNGKCTDPDDEPGTGALPGSNPVDWSDHGTHVASVALGK